VTLKLEKVPKVLGRLMLVESKLSKRFVQAPSRKGGCLFSFQLRLLQAAEKINSEPAEYRITNHECRRKPQIAFHFIIRISCSTFDIIFFQV